MIETAVETVKEKIKSLIPATETATGLFPQQNTPKPGNQYDDDLGLQRALSRSFTRFHR